MKTKRGMGLLLAGALCLLAALGLTGWNLWDQARADRSTQTAAAQLEQQLPQQTEDDQDSDPNRPMPEVEVDGRSYIGLLEIPALGRTLPVLSQWSEQDLKIAPCRYQGSLYQGNLIIAGHNYRSHFGGFSRLEIGSPIYFTDGEGTRYAFTVDALETIPGGDIEGMESGKWDLTLFTCTWGGQSRLAVRCLAQPETESP